MEIRNIQWEDTLNLRHKVLWPNKDIEFCKVSGDELASHFGVYIENRLVSVASLFVENKNVRLRKFATLETFQGQGIGSQLLAHLIENSKASNAASFWCDARQSAVEFYSKFGMKVEGETFMKSGIPYCKMVISFH
jgi:predicted GNAT family N-acyltransferase